MVRVRVSSSKLSALENAEPRGELTAEYEDRTDGRARQDAYLAGDGKIGTILFT